MMLCSSLLFAQSFVVENLRYNEGLSNDWQWAYRVVLEDRFGFIWIATLNGVNRYDGYTLKQYLSSAQNERVRLPHQAVSAITEDKNGTIWFGSQKEGVFSYNASLEKFEIFKPKLADGTELVLGQINCLFASDDYLYISAPFVGNFKYDLHNKTIENLKLENMINVFDTHIYDFLQCNKNGNIVMLTGHGLFIDNQDSIRHIPISFEKNLRNFAEISDNKILVNSYYNVPSLIVDLVTGTVEEYKEEKDIYTMHHFLDKQNLLWYNSSDGDLKAVKIDSLNNWNYSSIINNYNSGERFGILDMIENSSGNYYFMTNGSGAGKVKSLSNAFSYAYEGNFTNFNLLNDKLHFWYYDSLFTYDQKIKTQIQLEKDNALRGINKVYKDRSGNYWISSYSDKSYILKYNKNLSLDFAQECRVFDDMAQMEDGMIVIDVKELNENPEYDFPGNYYEKRVGKIYPDFGVNDMLVSSDNKLWFASFKDGVYLFDPEKNTIENYPVERDSEGSFPRGNIKFMYETVEGKLIMYSDNSINIWNPSSNTFTYLTSEDDIAIKDILGAVQDSSGLVWFMSRSDFYSYDINTKELQSFKIPSHLKPKIIESNGFEGNIKRNAQGQIFYACTNGIAEFIPSALKKEIAPSTPLITDLYIDRKRIHPKDQSEILDSSILFQKEFELSYSQRNVGFSFISIEGKDLSVKYFYRLSGIQDEWIALNDERTIHFTNLDPGDYTFEIEVISGAGRKSEKTNAVNFTVKPPWYRSIWAYILYGLLLLLAVLSFIQVRIANAVRKLKTTEEMRRKISSDLHDDVGTILAGVAMQTEILSLNANNEDRDELIELTEETRGAMEKMRDIVWALDSRKDRYENLLDKMNHFADTLFGESNVEVHFDLNDIDGAKKINPNIRQNLYLIYKEALTNVSKHSNAKKIVIRFEKIGKKTRFSIWDNGTQTKKVKTDGLGLSNMKMRAESFDGDFSIDQSKGFEIQITF